MITSAITEAAAHAALEAHDPRFDGLFFTGVTSTGIYCRCICPARVPKRENRRFFPSAAAAEKAGFRPCLLCRPELAPGLAPIESGARLAQQALTRIEAGALEDSGLEALAAELGVTGRHLRRVMFAAFGASPIEIAQTARLLAAKRLLADTSLSMTQIAFASGFRSVRRFNAALKDRYNLTPQRMRGRKLHDGALTLTLASRGRFHAAPSFAFLARRAIAGMERVEGLSYTRTLAIGGASGWIGVRGHENGVTLSLSDSLTPALRPLVAAVRRAFDLDADCDAVDAHLGLGEKGVRLPGGVDGFEIAVRAVLGQQITVTSAVALTAKLVADYGAPLEGAPHGLARLFPTPSRLADARASDIAALGMPKKRAETLVALAKAAASGALKLERGAIAAGRAGLAAIPGIGPWTIDYVALRALGDPDAFPASDAVLRPHLVGRDPETWRPWRAYAVVRLWRQSPPLGAKQGRLT